MTSVYPDTFNLYIISCKSPSGGFRGGLLIDYIAQLNVTGDVRSKSANYLGIYDMSGNVYEWCFTWFPEFVGQCKIRRGSTYGSLENLQVGFLDSGPAPYDSFAIKKVELITTA